MRKQLELLAIFVHGMLAAFHLLGALYNFKRKNKYQAMLHLFVACYDIWAVWEHVKELDHVPRKATRKPRTSQR